jgi:hypothetical protein
MYQDPENANRKFKNLSALQKLADDIFPSEAFENESHGCTSSAKPTAAERHGLQQSYRSDVERCCAGTLMTTRRQGKSLQKSLRIVPQRLQSFQQPGVCAFQQGNIQAAQDNFDKAYSLNKSLKSAAIWH